MLRSPIVVLRPYSGASPLGTTSKRTVASCGLFSAVFVRGVATSSQNVGIKALYTYFPSSYVSQTELEAYDGVSAGKYTIGLGQKNMAVCGEREDINSICLSAVQGLFDKFGTNPRDVGRIEVGTETVIDKSKSVKTTLMDLFAPSGNTSLEGIDTTNACYGGTSALFNSLQWAESSYYDGRDAIAVAADIAVYEKGAARPTGGAGAVSMLVGPNAPLVFEQGLRGSYFENAYDFYKPVLSSEYPLVDGPLSNDCYLRALDSSYQGYRDKFRKAFGREFSVQEDVDYALFHSPYTKLVQKSWGRLHYLDFLTHKDSKALAQSALHQYTSLSSEASYSNKELTKALQDETKQSYAAKVVPSLLLPSELGNSYCGSLYTGLQSLVDHVSKQPQKKKEQRVLLFSYGSGLAATMFSLKIQGDVSDIAQKADIVNRLKQRKPISPADFTTTLKRREETHTMAPFEPTSPVAGMFPGTFYLKQVDDKYRRHYARV
eukprot:TRINITY_DN1148_c0_g1_i1.p1 TRINITY_DN1148_c0_g1~~TRINITY_DN1148_c0_g1_i1.p1  ORF type:complete len:490 (+),score=64.27 TRINITY_DN1148_c0_g1_i1:402-1871(+)